MRRSWIALAIVVVIIVVVVVISARRTPPDGGGTTPTTQTPAQPATEAGPATPTTQGPPAPDTARPATATAPDTAKPTTATPAPEPPKADALLQKAEALVGAKKPLEAIKALSAALLADTPPDDPAPVRQRLSQLVNETLFSPRPCPPLSRTCEVASGDTLWKLAKDNKTTVGLIQRINGLKSDALRVGQRLKVIPGGFDVTVAKSAFRLTVTKDGIWVRELTVGLGKDGSTPVGEFTAGHKLKQPTYFGDGAPVPFEDKKNNPLGTRWITIQGAGAGQYGIHGTWEPESMGKEMSKGCVRMLNEDVEWLFDLIVPGQSKIVIKP